MTLTHPFAHIMPGAYTYFCCCFPEDREAAEIAKASKGEVFTTNNSAGTCDCCHTGIMIAVHIRGANGIFKVGSDCARKAGLPVQEVEAITKTIAKRNTKLRNQKVDAKYQLALDWIQDNAEMLKTLPHPKGFSNLTLLNFLEWYKSHSGKSKFNEVIAQQRKLIEDFKHT